MASIGAFLRSLVVGPTAEKPGETAGDDAVPIKLPDARVIYAIGDIHGRHDCLQRLIARIQEDVEKGGQTDAALVFLGDYVDRGDDSRDVIAYCAEIGRYWSHEAVFLRGNHEDAMLTFLKDPVGGAAWLRFGGLSTLMSYGVPNVAETMPPEKLKAASSILGQQLPHEHLRFLESTSLTHQEGNLFFCHAGVDPSCEPGAQSTRTLMWGEGTASPPDSWGAVVIHGHDVVETPLVRSREINVDTGAYYSGRLTAVRLQSGMMSFLQT